MEDRLQTMLELQLKLQCEHMKDGNPQHLTGDEMADFMRWNAWAQADEIHEAMAEVGWKPWATHRGIAEIRFLEEMVDSFHFFMNMLLCALPDSPEVIAEKFFGAYIAKNLKNAQRQIDGYDGFSSKCPVCHRDLEEAGGHWVYGAHTYCSKACVTKSQEANYASDVL